MAERVCRYYTRPGGCSRGDRCTFSHVGPTNPVAPPAAGRGSPRGRGVRGRGGVPSRGRGSARGGGPLPSPARPSAAPAPDVPRGTCRFYWTTGSCKHEFECRFRHVNQAQSSGSDVGAATLNPSAPDINDFLSPEALARLSGSGTDAYFISTSSSLTPIETHNGMKRFLYDDFRFHKTFDIYAFVKLLDNASSINKNWVSSCLMSPIYSHAYGS